jgi:hypothetical protein
MKCLSFPQWKHSPLGFGKGSSGRRANILSVVAWLARGKHLLLGALVLDRSIGTYTLL